MVDLRLEALVCRAGGIAAQRIQPPDSHWMGGKHCAQIILQVIVFRFNLVKRLLPSLGLGALVDP